MNVSITIAVYLPQLAPACFHGTRGTDADAYVLLLMVDPVERQKPRKATRHRSPHALQWRKLLCRRERESTVIQFSNARTYDATCAFVRVLTDWVRGDVNILIQPATDAEVAMASAAAATAQADTVAAGIESRDTPPPAGDGTRLPLKVHALLGLAARDPEDVLPAPSEASRLDRGGKFGTAVCIDFRGHRAAATLCEFDAKNHDHGWQCFCCSRQFALKTCAALARRGSYVE